MLELNKRQEKILEIIEKKEKAPISFIFDAINNEFKETARITINRDLKLLVEQKLIIQKGRGRGVIYELSPNYLLLRPLNIDNYFKIEPDKRAINEKFNLQIFSFINNIFTDKELSYLHNLNKKYTQNVKKINREILKKEYERLIIEFSWKSSKIEGNTYTLLETEQLLKKNIEAKGHAKEEALMLLNHKAALDYVIKNNSNFKRITVAKIEDVHFLLTKGLKISRNLRKVIVRITGTKFTPLDNEHQIKEALQKTCGIVAKEKDPFNKALILMILIAYIQPFIDGNKRTSRLIGNAVLLANNICPLSYRSIDDIEYKKAVILFYEQNNIGYFKELFVDQFKFAVNNYFGT